MCWNTPRPRKKFPVRNPDQTRSSYRFIRPFRRGVSPSYWIAQSLLFALILVQGACSNSSFYEPVGYQDLYQRKILFLEPTHLKPIEKDLHKKIVDRLEEGVSQLPYLGEVVTREKLLQAVAGNPGALNDYKLFSDTLSVVGVAEKETSMRLGKIVNSELLMMVQPLYIPCPVCEQSNQLVLSGTLVEAGTGKILWRIQLKEKVEGGEPETFPEIAEEMIDDFFERITDTLRPKWHLLRFAQLAKL